jgi:hypothetical protein
MEPTDEALLHAFYNGDDEALEQLVKRLNPTLGRVARLILRFRTGSTDLSEWNITERLVRVWVHVSGTAHAPFGRWPHDRLTALSWCIYLLGVEMDRHLGFTPPF